MTEAKRTDSKSTLRGRDRKYLRGLAHSFKPLVQVGRAGLTEALLESLEEALAHHELIKVRFQEHKEEKRALTDSMAAHTDAEVAGIVGHVAILYRPAREPDRRRIELPA
jgi:RNA-binding protein